MGLIRLLSGVDERGQRHIPARALVSYSVDIVLKTALFIILVVIDEVATPFAQHFSLADISLQYPHNSHQKVPTYLLIIISGLCPALIIILYTLVLDGRVSNRLSKPARDRSTAYNWWQRLWELHSGVLGLLTGQGLAFVISSTLKMITGKPRPDLIARCLPRQGAADARPFGLVSRAICTQPDTGILNDGFRSFPSAHASSAFSGLFFLSLYLAAKLRIAGQRGDFWRSFAVLFPTLAAACVAVTRIMDSEHHGFDVLFGSVLGMFCAWVAYRQYFPPISHTWKKGRAYAVKTWGKPTRRPLPGTLTPTDLEKQEMITDAHPPGLSTLITTAPTPFAYEIPQHQHAIHLAPGASRSSITVTNETSPRSCRASLASISSLDVELAQHAYAIDNPALSPRSQYPPQIRKPVPTAAVPDRL